MGKGESRLKLERESEVKIKISDFTDSRIIKNRDKTKSFMVTIQSRKKRTILCVERAIKSSMLNKNENILMLQNYQQVISNTFDCGSVRGYTLLYEYC